MTKVFTYTIKYILFSAFLALFFGVWSTHASAAEQILSYDVDIKITASSTVFVTETITYDFGIANRHGIYRYIPTEHPQKDGGKFSSRYIDIEVQSVQIDGVSAVYTVEASKTQIFIKVGDPDKTLSGRHTYTLTYTASGALSYFEDNTSELYWNAIATEWKVSIAHARITLQDPDGIFNEAHSCYRGENEAQTECDITSVGSTGTVFIAKNLNPLEGVTIAQELDTQKVARNTLEHKRVEFFWIPVLIIWFIALGIFAYRYHIQFKIQKAMVVQYEPYKNFKPMYTGLLYDGNLDPKDITAGIVYLAQQGFLKIKKTDAKVLFFFEVDDYEITLLKPVAHIETAFQRELTKILFGNFPIVGNKVTLHKLKKNTQRQKENIQTIAYLKKDLEKDLKDAGFFQVHIQTHILFIILTLIGAGILPSIFSAFAVSFFTTNLPFIFIGIIGTVFILSTTHRRRTAKGYEALWYLRGFKEFLSVTDKERYAFHNAPKKSPETFMELLPYAIAFGVEEQWADVFKDITIPDPTWYEGGVGHFSAVNFSHSIGAFSTALASSSTPASSGGGSVGGGGGGGGGGSW